MLPAGYRRASKWRSAAARKWASTTCSCLQHALASEAGERLAGLIREQFPVALIDEFQDTDPVQYGIFERIYQISENRATPACS
jgi:hypothetical protein